MTDFSSQPWLASYADGVPATIDPPTQTLVDMLDVSVRRHRRRVALEFFGAETTYAELGDQVARAANALRKLGVRRGDRVALVLPNCPQHVVAFYAILRIGAIAIEHNPLYTERELRHQFEDHGAKVAIVWDKVAGTVVGFPRDVGVQTVVSVDVTRAMPLRIRVALCLPVKKARDSRTALTVGRAVAGAVAWSTLTDASRINRRVAGPGLS